MIVAEEFWGAKWPRAFFRTHDDVPPLLRGRFVEVAGCNVVGGREWGDLYHHVLDDHHPMTLPRDWIVSLPPAEAAAMRYMLAVYGRHPRFAALRRVEQQVFAKQEEIWALCLSLGRTHTLERKALWTSPDLTTLGAKFDFVKRRVTPEKREELKQLWNELLFLAERSGRFMQEYLT